MMVVIASGMFAELAVRERLFVPGGTAAGVLLPAFLGELSLALRLAVRGVR